MHDTMRTVVHTDRFVAQLAAIEPNVKRTDEFLEAAEWQICRNPQSGTQVGERIWRVPTHPDVGMPALNLYYAFTDDEVAWLWIEELDRDAAVVGSIPLDDLPF